MSWRNRIRRTDRSPQPVGDNSLVICDAIVRLVLWQGVTVRKLDSSRLTSLEQFVLEAAIALGRLTPSAFTTITGLPEQLLHPLARRLTNSGALNRQDTEYVAAPGTADAILKALAVPRYLDEKADFIYLPDTDDVVALDSKNAQDMKEVYRTRNFHCAVVPAPQSLKDTKRIDFLGKRLRERTVCELPDSLVDVAEDAEADTLVFPGGVCLAYSCSAIASRDERGDAIRLSLHPSPRVQSQRAADLETIQIEIGNGSKLATKWLRLADAPGEPSNLQALWRALAFGNATRPSPPQRLTVSHWRYEIEGLIAQTLTATRRNLSFDACIEIVSDDAHAELTIQLAGADCHADRLITIDKAIAAAHSDGDDPTPLLDLVEHSAQVRSGMPIMITREDVLSRVWQLGHFQLAYALTEPLDLTYD